MPKETLTKQEEAIMQCVWERQECTVRDVLNALPEPKPPYTTLASVMKVIENKGFLHHKLFGNVKVYRPAISIEQYKKGSLKSLIKNYFGGSMEEVLSYMLKEEKVRPQELEELRELIAKHENDKKDGTAS
ncbi:MAG: BlaI/MecI/CopY family transcriptional regulator [Nitritalea sp.]